MAEITVALIKTLRDKTNAGMMDCKAALKETDGDLEAAETVLRKKGIADADKKAGRAAKEGVIASRISDNGKSGVLVEVNCETDFVAKNDNFREFVEEVIDHVAAADSVDSTESVLAQPFEKDNSQTLDEFIKSKVGELGENMALSRCVKYTTPGEGVVATYIHMQGKVGVLVEVGTEKAATVENDTFQQFVKDLTLHIAASSPICLKRDEVPADLVEKEKDIFRDQMKDKPAEMIDRIIEGKMGKFYSNNCLLEQAFVKDTDKSIGDLAEEVGKGVDDTITIARFERYAVGEGAEGEA
ncbi:MAG: translation elongation factor Ts [Verrucomicrobiales bacterium]|nr:translation elongation factor Ts [Verrucomicrobiales bacterium]